MDALKPLCLTSLSSFDKGSDLLIRDMRMTFGSKSDVVSLGYLNPTEALLCGLGFVSPVRDSSASKDGFFKI